jgi:hypothetical protein
LKVLKDNLRTVAPYEQRVAKAVDGDFLLVPPTVGGQTIERRVVELVQLIIGQPWAQAIVGRDSEEIAKEGKVGVSVHVFLPAI